MAQTYTERPTLAQWNARENWVELVAEKSVSIVGETLVRLNFADIDLTKYRELWISMNLDISGGSCYAYANDITSDAQYYDPNGAQD